MQNRCCAYQTGSNKRASIYRHLISFILIISVFSDERDRLYSQLKQVVKLQTACSPYEINDGEVFYLKSSLFILSIYFLMNSDKILVTVNDAMPNVTYLVASIALSLPAAMSVPTKANVAEKTIN